MHVVHLCDGALVLCSSWVAWKLCEQAFVLGALDHRMAVGHLPAVLNVGLLHQDLLLPFHRTWMGGSESGTKTLCLCSSNRPRHQLLFKHAMVSTSAVQVRVWDVRKAGCMELCDQQASYTPATLRSALLLSFGLKFALCAQSFPPADTTDYEACMSHCLISSCSYLHRPPQPS